MDFSIVQDPLSNSRMIKVILSENGSLHEYGTNKFISPIGSKKGAFLLDLLQKDHFIKKENQLVLREDDGEQMEPNTNLEQFFQKDLTVYVYVINEERKKEAHEEFEVIDSVIKKWSESIIQFLPNEFKNTLGSNIRDFLDSASASQYDEVIGMFTDTKNEISLIKEGNIKLQRQKTAEGVAKKNFISFYNERKKRCNEKLNEKEQQLALFQEYLNNFDVYIDLLSKKPIAPQLGETDKKNLVDYFNIDKLREFKKNSEINLGKITLKGQKIKEEIIDYGNELQNFHCGVTDNSTDVVNLLREEENVFVDIEGQTIQGFQNLVEEKKRNPTQKDLCEFVKREYENSLPKLREIYQRVSKIRSDLETQLTENGTKLQELVNFLLKLKQIMKGKLQNKIKLFSTVVDNQSEEIFNIEIIEKFPMVYEQSLNEIKRRTNFKKDFFAVLRVLEAIGDNENKKRREFLEKFQQYLPKTFCPFLSKSFSQLNFEHIKKLIDQDIIVEYDEVDEYAGDKVLTKLIEKLDSDREFENQKKEFENTILSLKKENEVLQSKMSQNSVEKIKDLFISSNFGDLTEKMDEFKKSVGSSMEKYMERIEKLKAVEPKLQQILESKNNQKQALETQQSIQVMLEEYKGKVESLQKLVLEKERERLEKESQLKEKVAEFEKEKKQWQSNLSDKSQIEQRVNALAQEKTTLEQQVDNLQKEKKGLENQILLVNTQNADILKQIEILGKVQKESEAKQKAIIQENEAKHKEIIQESEAKHKEMIKKSEAKYKAIIQENETSIKTLEKNCVALKDEVAALLQKNQEQKTIMTNLEKENEMLEARVNAMKQSTEGKEADVNSEIQGLQNLNQYLNEQLENLNASLVDQTKLKEKISHLEAIIQHKEEINADNNRVIQEYQLEIEEIRNNTMKNSVIKTNVLDATEKMMAEIGERIVMLYTVVVGQNERLSTREHDLLEILDVIAKRIQRRMATFSDLAENARVIAVRVNQSESDYVLVQQNNLDVSMVYYFKADQNYGDVITGVMDAFGESHYGDVVSESMKVEIAVEAKLREVTKICDFIGFPNKPEYGS